jgi:hypothetical protein
LVRFSFTVDAKGKGSEEELNCFQSRCCQKSLCNFGLYHVPARSYCSLSSAWELLEDPLPRLVSFLYAGKRRPSRSDHWLCLLVLERPSQTSIIVAVAQTTVVIAAGRLTPLRCKRLGILGVGYSRDFVRSVPLLSATLPFQLRRIVHLDRPPGSSPWIVPILR